MGGKSTTEQAQTQSSTTAPWAQAQPALQGILSQLQGQLGNTGITGAENSAINNFSSTAGKGNPFSGLIGNFANELLTGGGGATAPINLQAGPNQAGAVSQTLADYQRRLNPIADGANIGPGGNPQLKGYLDTIANDVQTRVNGMFAGAGRDLSGMNQGQLARGITEGTAPILAAQYNTDVGNMRSATDSLYGAGNTTSGLLSGIRQQDYDRDYQREMTNRQLGQQGLANRQAGVGIANGLYDQNMQGARSQIEAEALRRGIPIQALGLLANIGIPIAGLGQQSTGQGTTKGQSQMSGAQQFGLIAGGIGSLMPKFPISFGA